MDISQEPCAQRRAVPPPIVGEKLALEPRDVHADGAFGLARAALETEIQHLFDAVVSEARFAKFASHRKAQGIGSTPRRVRLLTRRHVGRAHRPVHGLAAHAEATAHFHGAGHAAVLRVIEKRDRLRRAIAGAVPQIGRQRRRIDNLAGVENAVWIERLFDLPECRVEGRAEHLFHERAAHQAVAMLTGERATELEHEIGACRCNVFELAYACLGFQVDHRPDVQTPDRGMRVDSRVRAVLPNHGEEPIDVVAQSFRRHGRVFDERQRLRVALHGHRQAQCRFADATKSRSVPRPSMARW